MDGRAVAPACGTVLNALATGVGGAFAIDVEVTATVHLTAGTEEVTGTVTGHPDADTSLVERCVSLTTDTHGTGERGNVQTKSDVPLAAGLKSSSAAANATVLATLDALGSTEEVSRRDAARLGVQAARETGVTVTGAFDDASASMLGGLTITDNTEDDVLVHDDVDWSVLVWTPPEQAFSANADGERCRRVAPVAKHAEELARAGRYAAAMTINGLAFCAALDRSTDPVLDALPHTDGVSLSGTGPSYVAVGEREPLTEVKPKWDERPGTVRLTTTQSDGARTI